MESTQGENFNPYKVLNLPEEASQKEVKSRFFSLSKAFHPDKQPTDLFHESSTQFELIEEAYKILSTPMRKYIFDKYGVEGIKVYHKKAGKLENLEEEYKHISTNFDSVKVSEEATDVQVKEAKAELKLIKQKAKSNVEYLHRRIEEENASQTYAKEVAFSQTLSLEHYVDYYIKGTSHAKLAKVRGLHPKIGIVDLRMNHWVFLPDYKGMQHMIGGYGFTSKGTQTGFGLKYRFRRVIPKLWGMELVGVGQLGDDNQELSLNFNKVFAEANVGSNNGLTIGPQGIKNFSMMFSRSLADDLVCYTQGNIGEEGADIQTGYTKEFKEYDLKLDGNWHMSQDKIRLTTVLTHPLTKRLNIYAQTGIFVHPQLMVTLSVGYNYKISSISKFSFSGNFVGTHLSWELKYSRLALKLKLPIVVNSHSNLKVFLLHAGVLLGTLWATSYYDNHKKRTKRSLHKLERRHLSRLMDGRRALNSAIGEANVEVAHNLANEIERRGVVILKASYGHPEYIRQQYLKELKKWGYSHCFTAPRPVSSIIGDYVNETARLGELETSELADLRVLLQQMVNHSELRISLKTVEEIRGIYNPCLDDTQQPWLLLVVSMNGKILIRLLKKKRETVIFSRDYDQYIEPIAIEPRYSLKNYFGSFFV